MSEFIIHQLFLGLIQIFSPINRLGEHLDELQTVLTAECDVAVKFEKEFEELNVWLTDTRSMLEVTGSPSSTMGVPASAALLRGKYQVRGHKMKAKKQGWYIPGWHKIRGVMRSQEK